MGEIYTIDIDTSKIEALIAKIEKLQNGFNNIQAPKEQKSSNKYAEEQNMAIKYRQKEIKEEEKQHKAKMKRINDENRILQRQQNNRARLIQASRGNIRDMSVIGSLNAPVGKRLQSAMSMYARNPAMSTSWQSTAASGAGMAAVAGTAMALGGLIKTVKILTKAGLILGGVFTAMGIAAMRNVSETKMAASASGLTFGQQKGMEFASNMMGFGREGFNNAINSVTGNLFKYGQAPAGFAGLGLDWEKMKGQDRTTTFFDILKALNSSQLPEDVKTDFANRVGLDYNQFRPLIDNSNLINESEKYYKQGMGIFGGQSGNGIQAGERSIKLFHAQLESLGMMIGGQIAPVLSMVLKNLMPYIKDFAKAFVWMVKTIFSEDNMKKFQNIFNAIRRVFTQLVERIFSPDNLAKLRKFVDGLLNMVGGLAKYIFSEKNINSIGKIFDTIVEYMGHINFKTGLETLKGAADLLGKVGSSIYTLLTNMFSTFDTAIKFIQLMTFQISLKDFAKGVVSNHGKTARALVNTILPPDTKIGKEIDSILENIINDMNRPAMKRESEAPRGRNNDSNLPNRSVKDAVISKSGRIITTDPQDYIFAMKQPQKLAQNPNATYNININANVRNDQDVIQIKTDLERLIRDLSRNAIRV